MAQNGQALPDPTSEYLTVGQAATLLNVHPNTVRRYVDQGLIRCLRFGPRGHRRIFRSDIDQLVSDQGNYVSSPQD